MKVATFLLVGFFCITAFTAIVTVLANINILGPDVMHSDFANWGLTSVIVTIVSSTILAFKRLVISTPEIMLVFNLKSQSNLEITPHVCSYEISDTENRKVHTGEVNLVRDITSGFLRCFIPIPSEMKYQYITTIRLMNDQGEEVARLSDYILQHTLEVDI